MPSLRRMLSLALRVLRPAALCILGLSLGPGPIQAQSPVGEYQVKARLLRTLLDYVAWPKAQTDLPESREVVVLGLSPFEGHLDKEVSFITGAAALRTCYARRLPSACRGCVVFICSSEEENLPQILSRLKGMPILTVGDTPGFVERGVMIGMTMVDGRIQLEVNLRSLRDVGLDLSPQLLRKATIIARPDGK